MKMKRILGIVLAVVMFGVLLAPAVMVFAQPAFATEAFARVWNRQDRAVFEGFSDRSWTWGPQNISPQLSEAYEQGIDGQPLLCNQRPAAHRDDDRPHAGREQQL
jgi:hypothetical protein